MVEIETTTGRCSGTTFVKAVVTNDRSTPQRIRLRSTLDGPTWPPRRNGVPAPAWSGDVWTATVEPDRSVGLGFASPAEPTADPLELRATTRATTTQRFESPREVLATLEDPAPPGPSRPFDS